MQVLKLKKIIERVLFSQCISRVYITPGLQLYQVQNDEVQNDEVQSDEFQSDEFQSDEVQSDEV